MILKAKIVDFVLLLMSCLDSSESVNGKGSRINTLSEGGSKNQCFGSGPVQTGSRSGTPL